MPADFPPFSDRQRFPLLANASEIPPELTAVDAAAFYAPEEAELARSLPRIKAGEKDWHLYGDARWPEEEVWVEFPAHRGSEAQGMLVVRAKIAPEAFTGPDSENELAHWLAENSPLTRLVPALRAPAMLEQTWSLYMDRLDEGNDPKGPADQRPCFVQAYIIYRGLVQLDHQLKPEVFALYADLLNAVGEVIAAFRMAANTPERMVPLAQFALHAVLRLNQARFGGTPFQCFRQLAEFVPVPLAADGVPPRWVKFHPVRTLRTHPTLRAMPLPKPKDGVMWAKDFEAVCDVRARAWNRELTLFERLVRPADRMTALDNTDSNACLSAVVHRASGGAIYVLPDRLVEEFHHTDCREVRVADITLPFSTLFLRFDPPEPVFLSDGARVDGCYLSWQGSGQEQEMLVVLTSRLEGVDYERSSMLTCIDPIFSLHLPAKASNAENTAILDAVEMGITDFLERNAPPTDNQSGIVTQPDGREITVMDVRAESRRRRIAVFREQEPAFRACLNIVVNAACFVAFYPEDVEDAWAGEPPAEVLAAAEDTSSSRGARDRRAGALLKLRQGDYTRIKVCGRSLFAPVEEHGPSTGTGRSPRAHWRRGHWRRQKHGTGLTLVTLRFIRPVLVMRESGTPVEARIYDVDERPAAEM